jgi:transcriptional regulator with XRE-family HTH domain
MDMVAKHTNEFAGERALPGHPHPLDVALGVRIRRRRMELGFSQEDLARRIGISFQQIQKYEQGVNRVSFSRLVEISHALNCTVMYIVGDLDKPRTFLRPERTN